MVHVHAGGSEGRKSAREDLPNLLRASRKEVAVHEVPSGVTAIRIDAAARLTEHPLSRTLWALCVPSTTPLTSQFAALCTAVARR
jgi:hypothetical protein